MRALGLRTQMVLVIIFVWLYSLGVGVSYWIQSRARARLEAALAEDLTVLADLPRLRERLRELDGATNDYLLTGDRQVAEKRRESVDQIRRIESELSGVVSEGRERETFKRIDRLTAAYLAQQNQWIERKEAGQLPRAEAARLVGRAGIFNELSNLLIGIKDVNVESLRGREEAVKRAARNTLWLILGTGAAAGGLIAFLLARYLVGPVSTLSRQARQWALGEEWGPRPEHASPEIEDLLECLREMTARLNLQYQKERELVEFKTKLVSMVSHEFNNALSIINGVAILLKETDAGPQTPKRQNYYGILDSHIRALSLASSNLLDMGRLETGKFAVKPRRAELGAVLRETYSRLRLLYERKELKTALEVPAEPVFAQADPEALQLVTTNLLSNAIKYTPEKGRVTLGLKTAEDGAEIFCRDTGIGISPEDQEKILTGYYRTESGKKAAKGFGVGLALANSIVEAHGSRLEIQSEPGQGSRFSFKLPPAPPEE